MEYCFILIVSLELITPVQKSIAAKQIISKKIRNVEDEKKKLISHFCFGYQTNINWFFKQQKHIYLYLFTETLNMGIWLVGWLNDSTRHKCKQHDTMWWPIRKRKTKHHSAEVIPPLLLYQNHWRTFFFKKKATIKCKWLLKYFNERKKIDLSLFVFIRFGKTMRLFDWIQRCSYQ